MMVVMTHSGGTQFKFCPRTGSPEKFHIDSLGQLRQVPGQYLKIFLPIIHNYLITSAVHTDCKIANKQN
jgi:hypothetical protein